MSTVDYGIYKIGTVGMEPIMPDGFLGKIITLARMGSPQLNIAYLTLSAIITKLDSGIPTYGLWAGPGWNAGERPSGDEINWATPPCYNQNVKTSPTPEDCYSLVDAITKTHDWRYCRLLKNSHMLRCAASVGVAAYTKSTPHLSGFARLASEHF